MKSNNRRVTRHYYHYFHNKYWAMFKLLSLRCADTRSEYEDYCNVASRELLYCMIKYNPNIGSSLTTFVHSRISYVLKRMRAKELKYRQHIYPSGGYDFSSVVEGPDQDTKYLVAEILSHLGPKEQNILKGSFIEGKTLRQLAGENGVSYQTILNIKERAIKKIRNRFPHLC